MPKEDRRIAGNLVSLYQIDPLQDPRWVEFLERHVRASVYHLPGWLEALRRTYGYECFVLTTSPPDAPLTNGLPVCRVRSWLTGNRLVSLPFSDHCDPLVDHPEELAEILSFLAEEVSRGNWDYAEIRPEGQSVDEPGSACGFRPSQTFSAHRIDLSPSAEALFAQFQKSGVQRKIRRAEREGLQYEQGRSELLLAKLFRLLQLTRRRHGLPPQPVAWFRNLIECLGDKVTLHIASHEGQSIAGILTISFKKTLIYKYGGSDARHHNLGGMPFLFWQAIQQAKAMGLEELDLGRSDLEDVGLIDFKRHLGAASSTLVYHRFSASRTAPSPSGWKLRAAKRVFSLMPGPVLSLAGKLLYRHFG